MRRRLARPRTQKGRVRGPISGHSQRLHVDRDLTDQSKVSFSVARRVNRPDAEALNPFSDHQDIHNLRSTTGLNLKSSIDFHPTKLDTGQISLNRTDRRLTAQGSLGPVTIVNLGYRRQVAPDIALVVTCADALNGQVLHRTLSTPALQDDYERRQIGRIAYFGLVYTFGQTKKAKSPGFDYDPGQ